MLYGVADSQHETRMVSSVYSVSCMRKRQADTKRMFRQNIFTKPSQNQEGPGVSRRKSRSYLPFPLQHALGDVADGVNREGSFSKEAKRETRKR